MSKRPKLHPSRAGSALRSAASVVHVFVVATYPLVAMYVHNADQMQFSSILRPWALSLAMAGLLLAFFGWLMRDLKKGAIATSLAGIVFWSYGHLYDGLKEIGLSGSTVVRHRFLLPIAILLLTLAIWRVRRLNEPDRANALISTIGLAALALPLAQLGYFEAEALSRQSPIESRHRECSVAADRQGTLPDIYLIIMDAYERDDILRDLHDYDNGPFLAALESRGFYVARGSLSNYRHTEISLASLMNLDYIQSFPESYSPHSSNRMGVIAMIRDPRLRRELECIGYVVVAFETGVFWTEWNDADFFLTREGGILHDMHLLGGVTRVESLLAQTTALRALLDLTTQMEGINQPTTIDPLDDHRERILFAFAQLGSVPSLPSPKLIYMHILSPHPPMVFGRNGEAVHQARFETAAPGSAGERALIEAYADQVHYLNGRLLEAVDAILSSSDVEPIIIIQGDHGWAERNEQDKLSILNAYYLPGGGSAGLYPTITPVNTFRFIFDTYFGADFGLLPDVSYFSNKEAIFKFIQIENTWSQDD